MSGWNRHSFRLVKDYMEYFSHDLPIFRKLDKLPGIVAHNRIDALRQQLSLCQQGKNQLFHGGDCAQAFEDIEQHKILSKLDFFKKIRQQLSSQTSKKSTIIGRIAGQYAKPRSEPFVMINGQKIHNYKGDIVNSLCQSDRQPSTDKLMEGYYNSMLTHNAIQSHFPQLYTSHEGLVIPYEASLTRNFCGKNYCLSAHMIWIGERTRQIDGAHIQYFRGLQNPIGIKISSKIDQKLFLDLAKTLNPRNQKGKLLIITRMGKNGVTDKLNTLIKAKKRQNLNCLFVCDPMHGNTFQSNIGDRLKTRNIEDLLFQINFFKKCMNQNHQPYGISLQSTFQSVTECFGLQHPVNQQEIKRQTYTSKCDPRLNFNQTLSLLKKIDFPKR